ncbi:hypothetical protein ACLF9Y_03425 [Helicobacter pylori]
MVLAGGHNHFICDWWGVLVKPLSDKNNHVSLLELESYKIRAVADDKSVLLDFVL